MNHSLNPPGIRLAPDGVARATSDLLASQSERRKRGRPGESPVSSYGPGYGADAERKRRALAPPTAQPSQPTQPTAINAAAAKKAGAVLVQESPTYARLIASEERIDLAIMRKQQDIKDALKNRAFTSSRVFRLYLFNTFRAQDGQGRVEDSDGAGEGGSDDEEMGEGGANGAAPRGKGVGEKDGNEEARALDVPSWSLRVQGQFLPETVEGDGRGEPSPPAHESGGSAIVDAHRRQPMAAEAGTSPPMVGTGGNAGGSLSTDRPAVGAPGAAPPQPTRAPPLLKCTDVFRRVVIELDADVIPQNNLVEWNRADGEAAADGFELSRAGDKECNARIFLYLSHVPERFKLSYPLSRLVGVKSDTRSNVFMAVWQYIKKAKLQCDSDRTSVRIDTGLRTLMPATYASHETIKLQHLFEVIKMHMGPPDPIQLDYTIKLSGSVVDNQACFDIKVDVPDESLQDSASGAGVFGLTYPNSSEFVVLGEKHVEALEKIAHHKRRRDFLEGFCSNPVEFINNLILSQTRDLKTIAGSSGRNPEEERRASFYQQQWVREAVPRYLLRKAIADTAKKASENL